MRWCSDLRPRQPSLQISFTGDAKWQSLPGHTSQPFQVPILQEGNEPLPAYRKAELLCWGCVYLDKSRSSATAVWGEAREGERRVGFGLLNPGCPQQWCSSLASSSWSRLLGAPWAPGQDGGSSSQPAGEGQQKSNTASCCFSAHITNLPC